MRLTDEQILYIFTEVSRGRGAHDSFIRSYADALCQATRKDFYILRPASIVLIAKYSLGQYLDTFVSPVMPVHTFPNPRRTA